MIRLLCEASCAGVQVDLLVRGICCLRPGIPGVSENIRVISIVGRFLEHSRIFCFRNGGNEEIYLGSADLMPRNLNRRVEVLFPVSAPRLVARLRDEILDPYLADDAGARHMRSDGSYTPKPRNGKRDSQAWFMAQRTSRSAEPPSLPQPVCVVVRRTDETLRQSVSVLATEMAQCLAGVMSAAVEQAHRECLSTAVAALRNSAASRSPEDQGRLYVIAISKGVGGGNVAVYLTDEGVILVDDMFDRNYDEIMAKVKSLTDKPVRYVLNTHQHDDHAGGNARMMMTAEVIAHRNARANMVALKQPGPPRLTFSEEIDVHLGGKEVRARHYGRGHTGGDAIIYFPALKVIHTGDLFLTYPPLPFIDYANGGSALEWNKNLDEVLKTDFEVAIPGHGPVSDRAGLRKFRDNFETMRNRINGDRARRQRQGRSDEGAGGRIRLAPKWIGDSAGGRVHRRVEAGELIETANTSKNEGATLSNVFRRRSQR